ncbi:hypothetical protein SAMN05216582_11131 [Selenomonas ruminantium]|uniref:Uncharacterized protein n=1 Tax=Selenomonas ruminantium TaxID=971 RepID=A0A1M6U8F0_SELRU|nr:DUF6033 family protein [Selenomonas ruminantium]SHK65456.1 hypothetical protein SAMN05216582_11131 [Selenomonas ruminantium]
MVNSITNQQLLSYQKSFSARKNEENGKLRQKEEKDPLAQYGADTKVELSDEARAAYANQVKGVKAFAEESNSGTEKKAPELSSRAQDLLGKLQEKYGDKYDFFVVDDEEALQNFQGQGSKGYSVVFTKDELEHMANDEEYAQKVMDTVDSIVDKAKEMEEKGELGEGVRLKSVMISVEDDGNMRLFAQIEKMGEEQQERLEKAKEKHAEEKQVAEDKADEKGSSQIKSAIVEAFNAEELWAKIQEIDWTKINDKQEKDE